MATQPLTLFELQRHVRRVLALNFDEPVWITAEVSQISSSGGHSYLTLVQKDSASDKLVAQCNGVLWRLERQQLQASLSQPINQLLNAGSEVSVMVEVSFHELYGYKVSIKDIDESYTLGKVALQRQQTIKRLQEEERMHLNGQLVLPEVVQRIAVISSQQAAGFRDFIQQLSANSYGYNYHYTLYQNSMQGNDVGRQISANLEEITKQSASFDVIVILRGGGAKLDLRAFDDYELCKAIAHAPLPVITAIGHDTDLAVADMVSATSVKTPTAAADFVIERSLHYEVQITQLLQQIERATTSTLHTQKSYLLLNWQRLQHLVRTTVKTESTELNQNLLQIRTGLKNAARRESLHVSNIDEKLALLDPKNTMARGFAVLAASDGTWLRSASQVSSNDIIENRLSDGKLTVTVTQKQMNV